MSSKLTYGDLQIIAGVTFFQGLKLETVEHIVASATAIMLKPHELLFYQDDPATAFFIVIDGYVKLFRIVPSGDEAMIRIMTKGDSVAQASSFTGAKYMASAQSINEARVVRIPADHVIQRIRENPDVALAMIASTSRHLNTLMQEVEQLKTRSGIQRLAKFLISLSPVDHGPCEITLPYDKLLIAARLGLRPESLSRHLTNLKSLGVVVNASHVAISDVAKLHQLAINDRSAIRGKLEVLQ